MESGRPGRFDSRLQTSLLDFPIPSELIAQSPAERRDASRLLVVDRAGGTISHRHFADLLEYLNPGDVLFRNNATVFPARLRGVRPEGGGVECLLLEEAGIGSWRCMIRPGRKLAIGASFSHPTGAFHAVVTAKEADGVCVVSFVTRGDAPLAALCAEIGEVPLPPYIHRKGSADRARDVERYQTVYADPARPVAVAAPTAGLHFTPELLAGLSSKGMRTADLTLHVGLGTFKPIGSETVERHAMHRETYEMPVATQRALFDATAGRRIAVGTTSVRAIEDFLENHSRPLDRAYVGQTTIFIHPPRGFDGVDALITNFHQPRSTLICLVAAFLAPGSTDGLDWLKRIYAEAVALRYRFFSYGDAMLIL